MTGQRLFVKLFFRQVSQPFLSFNSFIIIFRVNPVVLRIPGVELRVLDHGFDSVWSDLVETVLVGQVWVEAIVDIVGQQIVQHGVHTCAERGGGHNYRAAKVGGKVIIPESALT